MRKIGVVGLIWWMILQSASAFAGEGGVIAPGRIARYKAMLKLNPEQERYWAPVEAMLSDLARQPDPAAALDRNSLNRLLVVTMPLFERLNVEQRRELLTIARSMGVLAVAFR
jgi:hypothetical protein